MSMEKNNNSAYETGTSVGEVAAENIEVNTAGDKTGIMSDLVDELGVISSGTKVSGKIITKGHLAVSGQLVGDVEAEGNVIVSGGVVGNIACGNLLVESGTVKSDTIKVTGHVEIKEGAAVVSDISCGSMLLSGSVSGNVAVEKQIAMSKTAAFEGNLSAGAFGAEFGARMNGQFSIR